MYVDVHYSIIDGPIESSLQLLPQILQQSRVKVDGAQPQTHSSQISKVCRAFNLSQNALLSTIDHNG
jgi:hypothetical protein